MQETPPVACARSWLDPHCWVGVSPCFLPIESVAWRNHYKIGRIDAGKATRLSLGFVRRLADLFSCRVVVDNDSKIAAFGEASLGNGKSFSFVLYSNVGSGIGAGFVKDGTIYHGSQPGELELGYIRVSKLGGTVESRCSGWAIDRRIREVADANPQSILGQLYQRKKANENDRLGGEAAILRPALKESDADAEGIVDEAARTYAWALSHAVHLLSPEVIVLGGGLSLLGEPWRSAVQGHLRSFLMDAFLPGPEVFLASLGEDVVPVGAACYAMVQNREGVHSDE